MDGKSIDGGGKSSPPENVRHSSTGMPPSPPAKKSDDGGLDLGVNGLDLHAEEANSQKVGKKQTDSKLMDGNADDGGGKKPTAKSDYGDNEMSSKPMDDTLATDDDDGGSPAPTNLPSTSTTSRPGAHHVPGPGANDTPAVEPMPGTFIVVPGDPLYRPSDNDDNDDTNAMEGDNTDLQAESRHIGTNGGDVAAEAYLVEPTEEPPSAIVVDTIFGIERKRLLTLTGGACAAFAIVLATVLGILIPRSKQSQQNVKVCGPLCGVGTEEVGDGGPLPDPNLVVYGHQCKDWEFNSTNVPLQADETCPEKYLSAAYGCGCEEIEIPESGCGNLCTDGSELPNPEYFMREHDMKLDSKLGVALPCKDWELKSQFDTDPNECPNYNAIGAMCGCPNNEPHPDACGPMCGEGDKFQHSENHPIWKTRCRDWNIMSMYLPIWYNNPDNESCQEYYQDLAYGCACPGVTTPPIGCGKLCQERSLCDPICDDGSNVPDPNFVARRETCAGWEFQARTEVHSVVCPLYHMTGAMCGCDNEPHEDGCGPLCGPGQSLPYPDRLYAGQSCSDWDYASRFLPDWYQLFQEGNGGTTRSCSDFFDKIAYGCGCQGFDPPSDGCGMLCNDGSQIPDPDKVVAGRTCRDREIDSLFQTDKNRCMISSVAGTACGCPGGIEYTEECFRMEHLQNLTLIYPSSNSVFRITFGDDGAMAAILGNGDWVLKGYLREIEDGVAKFGGGAPCGVYGPRTGHVNIIENELVTEPTIVDLYEASICVDVADLHVPKFCPDEEEI